MEDQQEASVPAAERRLETWKEIAEYLRREIRTVQRWEREQGLPVRRHAHQKRSSVYAFARELDEWRVTRAPKLDQPPQTWWSRRAILLTAAASVLLAVLPVAGWRTWSRFHASPAFQKTEMKPLIATGNAVSVAISPDNRYLAYSLAAAGGQTAWLRELASGTSTQIGAPAPAYHDLSFSPDGEFLRYFQAGGLYQTPIRGGPVNKIAPAAPGYLALSPDGKRVALRRSVAPATQLLVASPDGSGERSIASRKSPESIQYFSWSPDGKRIAFVAGSSLFAGTDASLVVVDVESGREHALGSRKWWSIDQVAWLPNGRGLLLVAREPPLKIFRPWYLSYPEGEAHPITNDLLDYRSLSPAKDSRSFVSVQEGEVSSLWVTRDGASKRITSGMRRRDGVGGIAWTPDGRIAYVSSFTGSMQVWISGADGRDAKAMTPAGAENLNPSVCPNGRYVVYNSGAGPAGRHVWRMELDGSRPQQLTTGADESSPICSPDSKWVMYVALTPEYAVMKVPIDGGAPVQITQQKIIMPSISPDGKVIMGTYAIGAANRVVTMPWEGGPVKMLFDIDHPKAHWSADGKSVLYFETTDGIRNIWSQALRGGEKRQLTKFSDNEQMRWFAVSPSNELAIARGTVIRDVVRIVDLN